MDNKKSTIFNINANLIVLIAYLGGLVLKWLNIACYFAWGLPLVLYLAESKNEFVKKQTSQATLLYLISSLISVAVYIFLLVFAPTDTEDIYNMIITGSLFLVGVISICTTIISIVVTLFAVVASIKTYNYEDYNIPYISKYLDKFRSYLEKIEGKTNNIMHNHPKENTNNNKESTNIKKEKEDINPSDDEQTPSEDNIQIKKVKPHKVKKTKDAE